MPLIRIAAAVVAIVFAWNAKGIEMLILERKQRQRVMIGEGPAMVVIEVLRSSTGRVKLGITAAESTPILREEVYLKNESERIDRYED